MELDQQIAESEQITLEDFFNNDPYARAEYEAQCEIWINESIKAQELEFFKKKRLTSNASRGPRRPLEVKGKL